MTALRMSGGGLAVGWGGGGGDELAFCSAKTSGRNVKQTGVTLGWRRLGLRMKARTRGVDLELFFLALRTSGEGLIFVEHLLHSKQYTGSSFPFPTAV